MRPGATACVIAALLACGCGASVEQQPATTPGPSATSRECADLDDAAERATAAGRRGEWGLAARLSVGADLLVDACAVPAVQARYRESRRALWAAIAQWRASQADLVERVRADADYSAALARLTHVGSTRATVANEMAPPSDGPSGGGGRGGGRAPPSQTVMNRAEEHAARAQMAEVLRRFGLAPEEARLLGLTR